MATTRRSVLLRLLGDPSDAKRGIDDVKDDLRKFDGFTAEARAEIKTEAAKAKLDKLHAQLKRLGSQESTPEVKIRTARVVSQIEKIENELDHAIGKPRRLRILGGQAAESRAAGAVGLGGLAAGAKAGVGGAVAAGAAGGLFFSAKAAIEAEVSIKKLRAQMAAAGMSYKAWGKDIDNVIQKQSQLSGLDDEDLQDSFTNILRVTGDVTKSLKLNAIAADLARAKHIDVAKAGQLVGKVAGGNVSALNRYGVAVKKGATVEEALNAAQKTFAGQAEAYGKTTQGSLDRLSVSAENLGEEIGKNLTPAIQWLADAIPKIGPAIREAIAGVRQAIGAVADFPGVRTMVRGVIRSLRGLVTFIKGVFHGDISEAWDGIKLAFSGGFSAIRGYFRAQLEPLRLAAKRIGGAIKSGIHAGLDGLVGLVRGIINKVIDAVNGITSGINKLPDPLGLIPHIDPIAHVGATVDGTGKIPKGSGVAFGRKGGAHPRSASGVIVQVTTPVQDPAVLGEKINRHLGRRVRTG